MKNANEIKNVAHLRLDEAENLYELGLYEGSIYLAGYAVELLLKAKICEILDLEDLFDASFPRKDLAKFFKIHNLENLIWLSGLRRQFEEDYGKNDDFRQNWDFINENWSEQVRYDLQGSVPKHKAEKFLNAITDNQNGIKSWISTH